MTLADVAYAASGACKIKLLGRCIRRDDGKLYVYVAPHLVPDENPLSGVEDVFNAITVKGNAVGDVMFYGRGAGKLPTASAVVADVMDVAQHRRDRNSLRWGPGDPEAVVPAAGLASPWYVRTQAPAERVREVFGAVKALSRPGAQAEESAFVTSAMDQNALEEKLAALGAGSAKMRVLE